MTFIALLRGINVVGHKIIKMAELAKLFESLKFRSVRTYVQSGNVIFETSASNSATLSRTIEMAIEKKFGFSVSVILRTPEELKKIVTGNPLLKDRGVQIERLYVTYLKELPEKKLVSSLEMNQASNEKYIVKAREIYLYCPNGYGRTKLNNNIFEKKLNVVATTRNWNTTTTLLEMAAS